MATKQPAMTKAAFLSIPENDRLNRTLKGTAMYAFLSKPNTSGVKKFNGDPTFEVTLLLDEQEAAKAEQEYGLAVNPPNDFFQQPWIKIKRKVRAGANAEDVRPHVVDAKQRPVPKSLIVGNGSEVICKFITGWPDSAKAPSAYLTKVLILKLVPYDGSSKQDSSLGIHEDGFSVDEYLIENNSEIPEEDTPFDKDV